MSAPRRLAATKRGCFHYLTAPRGVTATRPCREHVDDDTIAYFVSNLRRHAARNKWSGTARVAVTSLLGPKRSFTECCRNVFTVTLVTKHGLPRRCALALLLCVAIWPSSLFIPSIACFFILFRSRRRRCGTFYFVVLPAQLRAPARRTRFGGAASFYSMRRQ